jgi:hypothetical protein
MPKRLAICTLGWKWHARKHSANAARRSSQVGVGPDGRAEARRSRRAPGKDRRVFSKTRGQKNWRRREGLKKLGRQGCAAGRDTRRLEKRA